MLWDSVKKKQCENVMRFPLAFQLCLTVMQLFSPQIRNAWDNRKSMARNLQDMGLAFDPNRSLPLKKTSVSNRC